MYWFSRPPYGRWVLAAAIVFVAAYMDLTGPAMESYPFTATDTAQGSVPEIEWRAVPAGLLPAPGQVTGRSAVAIAAGTPLVPGLVDTAPIAPSDWWAVAIDLPRGASVGSDALLALPDQIVPGVVVDIGVADTFGVGSEGLVAVAADDAASVASAVAGNTVVVLLRP